MSTAAVGEVDMVPVGQMVQPGADIFLNGVLSMNKDYKLLLRKWREKHHPASTATDSQRICADRSGVSLRQFQRWESRATELNHGTIKSWPVPLWLRHRIDENKPLPPLKP